MFSSTHSRSPKVSALLYSNSFSPETSNPDLWLSIMCSLHCIMLPNFSSQTEHLALIGVSCLYFSILFIMHCKFYFHNHDSEENNQVREKKRPMFLILCDWLKRFLASHVGPEDIRDRHGPVLQLVLLHDRHEGPACRDCRGVEGVHR